MINKSFCKKRDKIIKELEIASLKLLFFVLCTITTPISIMVWLFNNDGFKETWFGSGGVLFFIMCMGVMDLEDLDEMMHLEGEKRT